MNPSETFSNVKIIAFYHEYPICLTKYGYIFNKAIKIPIDKQKEAIGGTMTINICDCEKF